MLEHTRAVTSYSDALARRASDAVAGDGVRRRNDPGFSRLDSADTRDYFVLVLFEVDEFRAEANVCAEALCVAAQNGLEAILIAGFRRGRAQARSIRPGLAWNCISGDERFLARAISPDF